MRLYIAKKLSKSILHSGKLVLIAFMLPIVLFAEDGERFRATPSASEGPYWKPGSPFKEVLYRQDDQGRKITVSGKVVNLEGKAIVGAKIDIWQTDGKGEYDHSGYRYRGHVLTDSKGYYSFKTVRPGAYPSRTPHIHVKVISPDGETLTTQLYFPDFETQNRRDYLFDERLSVDWKSASEAGFDFVLK